MGILNTKSRIMDSIVTLEGKQQISKGKMNVKFFSLSDSNVFYLDDTLPSGSDDFGKRISFEAGSDIHDRITFESDENGKIVFYKGNQIPISNGKVLTLDQDGSGNYNTVSGSDFQISASLILSSSIDNFSNLYLIGSPDLFDENNINFNISNDNIKFTITENKPIQKNSIQEIGIDHIESFYMDKRLSHIPNFDYLPPINKTRIGTNETTLLGSYSSLGQRPILEYSDIQNEIDLLSKMGFEKNIEFVETSKQNNIFCQFFELVNGEINKLSVIDFGLFNVTGKELSKFEIDKLKEQGLDNEIEGSLKHIFFVGKVFTDSNDTHNFVNIFTIVLDGKSI